MASRFLQLPDGGLNLDVLTPTGVVGLTTSAGGGGGGSVNSVTAAAPGAPFLVVNNGDPANPVVTAQAADYANELVTSQGGNWTKATTGLVSCTTISPRSTDGTATIEMTSSGGRMHLESGASSELFACTGRDLLLSANGTAARTRLQAHGTAGGRRDGVTVAIFNDGADHTTLGFYGTAEQQQPQATGTDAATALNALQSGLASFGLIGPATPPVVLPQKMILGFWGSKGAAAVAAQRFQLFGNAAGAPSATGEQSNMVMPIAGTMTDLYVNHSAALSTDTVTYTVFKNGVATAITCGVGAGGTQNHDSAHTFTFAAGDVIGIGSLQSSTQASASLEVSVACAYKSP